MFRTKEDFRAWVNVLANRQSVTRFAIKGSVITVTGTINGKSFTLTAKAVYFSAKGPMVGDTSNYTHVMLKSEPISNFKFSGKVSDEVKNCAVFNFNLLPGLTGNCRP